ncbi:MAG: M23 family metallopeptidase [Bacteroidales bacterium]|nr:M23 family metallopeptidase [Bacteroidales bacterium]
MFGEKKYIFNEQTKSYEIDRRSTRAALYRTGAVLLAGLACFLLFFFLSSRVWHLATPKERWMARRNRVLTEQLMLLSNRTEDQYAALLDLSRRDNLIYRPVFGMEELGNDVREAPLGGEDRYETYLGLDHQFLMTLAARRVDQLTRMAYVQSRSFDDVKIYSARAGDMASCIPSIYPVNPKTVQLTSPFGARFHPIRQEIVFHEGVDLAGPAGQDVYATGDGVVESTEVNFSGYGNVIVIDHGFGYKTRYAHLQEIKVIAGQIVIRGDKIGKLGSSGLSTGPHLHYEVLYRGVQVNPWNFLNPDISPEEYAKTVRNG